MFVSIVASCPSRSAHGAHRPGGEVRTLLLLGRGRDGEAQGGTGLREAPELGNPREGSKSTGLMGSCWGLLLVVVSKSSGFHKRTDQRNH